MAYTKAERTRRTGWRQKCQRYFEGCDRAGKRYTLAGLKLALEADEATWEELREDPVLRDILELAVAKIRDSLEQREDQMAILLMRRPEYGGGAAVPAGAGQVKVSFGDGGKLEDYGG